MSRIFIIRHGQSEYNAGLTTAFNSELTAKGIVQAQRAGLTLKEEMGDFEYEGIFSPYIRCVQTAASIHKYTGINFKVDAKIGERPEKVHRDEYYCYVPAYKGLFGQFDWGEFKSHDYGRESEEAYNKRIDEFLSSLNKDKNYVIVSHMTPSKDMVLKLCPDIDRDFAITNCSLTLIENRLPVYIGKQP
jgi:broad specificity phosphatase PhoE